MNQKLKWVGMGLAGIVGLVLVGFLCLSGAAALYQSDTVKGEIEATSTPQPSAPTTPEGATSTEPDPREAAYGEFFISLAATIQEGFSRFSLQNAQLSEKPSLLLDEEWIEETTTATEIIESEAQRTIEYTKENVPPRFAETHRLLVEAMMRYRDAMQLYRQGVEAQNVDSMTVNTLTEVQTLMDEGNSLVNQATEAMQ